MSIHRDLVFFRAGLLDPDQAVELADRLASDATLRARLAALDDRWNPEVDLSVPKWRLPPPGLGVGASAGLPMVFSASGLRPGDRFQVRIDPLPDPGARAVVVLRRAADGWAIRYPRGPREALRLDQLPRDELGAFPLDLRADADPGRQRWGVALPRIDHLVAQPRGQEWAWLRRGAASGRVPVATVDVVVDEAL
ncbi:MAG: hypothetical protein H6739_36955 [Alphaproteobacteria bacterium]|nr:hypothetical protein [Alphaproteobacteria bacterium]